MSSVTGGSETFKDKQDFFYHEVRKYHQKHYHEKLQMKVNREKLLESVSNYETSHFFCPEYTAVNHMTQTSVPEKECISHGFYSNLLVTNLKPVSLHARV
jgi:hypothetical protein